MLATVVTPYQQQVQDVANRARQQPGKLIKFSRGLYYFTRSRRSPLFKVYRYDDGAWGLYSLLQGEWECLWVDQSRKLCLAYLDGTHCDI